MNKRIEVCSGGGFSLRQIAFVLLLAFGPYITAYAGTYPLAPEALFTTAAGRTLSTTGLKGHPTLLWLLSTWCSSCAAGLQTLARHTGILQKDGLRVVVLRNYRNGGYTGPHIAAFTAKVLPGFKAPQNWVLGQASRALDKRYNARHYPDIYFLIDANGRIRAEDSAPSATFARILAFAKSQDNH